MEDGREASGMWIFIFDFHSLFYFSLQNILSAEERSCVITFVHYPATFWSNPVSKITKFPNQLSKTSPSPLCLSMLSLPLLPSHPLQDLPDFIPTNGVKHHLIEPLHPFLKFPPALLQPITSPPLLTRRLCWNRR